MNRYVKGLKNRRLSLIHCWSRFVTVQSNRSSVHRHHFHHRNFQKNAMGEKGLMVQKGSIESLVWIAAGESCCWGVDEGLALNHLQNQVGEQDHLAHPGLCKATQKILECFEKAASQYSSDLHFLAFVEAKVGFDELARSKCAQECVENTAQSLGHFGCLGPGHRCEWVECQKRADLVVETERIVGARFDIGFH
jgi:hypothetical protein